MIHLIESSTTAMLGAALDATTMRQQTIAQNIANANTPGYRAASMNFGAYMADVKETLAAGGDTRAALHALRPSLELAAPDALGSSAVALDGEVAKLSETMLHQQAVRRCQSRQRAQRRTGGRRALGAAARTGAGVVAIVLAPVRRGRPSCRRRRHGSRAHQRRAAH